MDLIQYNFQGSPLFRHLPEFKVLSFSGEIAPRLYYYEGKIQDGESNLLSSLIIRKSEKLIWQSFEELMTRMLILTAYKIKGFFELRLLSIDLQAGIKDFQSEHLSDLLTNKSKEMKPGEEAIIRYSSFYGIFKKRINEAWGKIIFLSPVETYTREPYQLDLFIKNMLKESSKSENPVMLAIHDLSTEPIFLFGDERQTGRLHKLFEKYKDQTKSRVPDIYIIQNDAAVELGAQLNPKSS